MKPFTFKIGGPAGSGISSVGLIFSKMAARSGYRTFDYMEYPSIVRGGHNVMQVGVSADPVLAPLKSTDFLVALDQETVDRHSGEMTDQGILVYDLDKKITVDKAPAGAVAIGLPLSTTAKWTGGDVIMRNIVALGAAVYLLGGELSYLQDLLAEQFAKKDPSILVKNQAAAKAGYAYAQEHFKTAAAKRLNPQVKISPVIVVDGNEAAALGAVAAGMQFAAIYPMTPTSDIISVLAPLQKEFSFIYKQPEDEIAAINMIIGASFAGARVMTATSGGGFALMSEGLGLAGMTETPLVIIMGQRSGPATGLPTWTEQGDARFVLHAHQSSFPRIVLAPGDANEVFHLTMQAFNLADKYQTPVIILVDKHVCECHQSLPPFDYSSYKIDRGKFTTKKIADYKRYELSPDGISLRAPAGSGNHVIANSDEHNTTGYSTEESLDRREQMEKRMQKLITCAQEDMPAPALYGPKQADLTIVSWGSNKGAILTAIKDFPNVNFLHLTWLSPFPTEEVARVLKTAKKVLNVENNYDAQVGSLIAEKTGLILEHNFLKYDGRPIYPEEIIAKITELL